MMQKNLGLKSNSKDRFALAEKFCYFGYAPEKSGDGIRTPISNRDFPSYFVMVDRLRRSIGSAVSLFGGSSNLRWSASISFEPNVGGKNKSNRGTTMINSWCSLLRDVCRQISNSFRGEILGKGAVL